MKTVYLQLTTYDGDYSEMLLKMKLVEIFNPIIEFFNNDASEFRPVIKYIAYVYSRESEYYLAKDDFKTIKRRCAEAAKLNERLHGRVMNLVPSDEEDKLPQLVAECAMRYLNFQNDAANRDLKSLCDLYEEMVSASHSPITDKDGKIDYQMKYNCRKYANDIRDWISSAEAKMKQEDSNIKAAIEDLKAKSKRHKASLNPERVVDNKDKT